MLRTTFARVPAGSHPLTTVPDLLAAALRADPSRPAVTWLDTASGARVELSVATVANWVAKTGGLLQDELDVTAGDRVRLSLPAHWLAVTWALGCWAVGAVVEPDDVPPGGHTDVEVFGDDRSPRTTARPVVVGLGPFGGPAAGGPAGGDARYDGALDAGAEVLGHPDLLVTYDPPVAATPALGTTAGTIDQQRLLDQARDAAGRLGLGAGARLLTDAAPASTPGLLEVVLAPLVVAGSVVLLSGPVDPTAVEALAGRERADVVRVAS